MIRIRAIEKTVNDVDESGNPITRTMLEPDTPIPANAARVECDGAFYTVYERGEE